MSMYVVTGIHKQAMWGQCYGPFDTYLEANEYWKENYSGSHYRTSVYEVVSPLEG
jgi:hypothetical protein